MRLILLAAMGGVAGAPVEGIAAPASTGTLSVTVTGFKNYQGTLNIAVFATAKGFPDQSEAAVVRRSVRLAGADPVFEFNDLSFGTYAVTVFHDENSNQQLDKNWLGIPKEGVGFSHNPKSLSSVPQFEDAKFAFESKKQAVAVKLIY